jgi:hypothetical protein
VSPERPQRKGFPTGGWVERGRTGTRRDRTLFPTITEQERLIPADDNLFLAIFLFILKKMLFQEGEAHGN